MERTKRSKNRTLIDRLLFTREADALLVVESEPWAGGAAADLTAWKIVSRFAKWRNLSISHRDALRLAGSSPDFVGYFGERLLKDDEVKTCALTAARNWIFGRSVSYPSDLRVEFRPLHVSATDVENVINEHRARTARDFSASIASGMPEKTALRIFAINGAFGFMDNQNTALTAASHYLKRLRLLKRKAFGTHDYPIPRGTSGDDFPKNVQQAAGPAAIDKKQVKSAAQHVF